jgi:ATP-dependent Lon protease
LNLSDENTFFKVVKGFPVGVVMGLAWSPLGGSPIFIETACIPVAYTERGSDSVNVITGQLVSGSLFVICNVIISSHLV